MSKTYSYYNEFDKKTANWLRQLIKNGVITDGVVDDRSITEVTANDIRGFNRVHWFAGIGTWDYALNKAGWGDREIWTASLPCQPFSTAGKGLGKSDERHFLPHFLDLVKQCKPTTIIGEQVESAIRHGWLDDLQTSMEAEGYSVGHCVLGAHSVNAPHQRQRLYWVANSKSERDLREPIAEFGKVGRQEGNDVRVVEFASGIPSGVGNTKHQQHEGCIPGHREESSQNSKRAASEFARPSEIEWIYCRDNKYRPIKPGIFPLVNGAARGMVPSGDTIKPNDSAEARAMRLKGYGNAIVAPLAIEFISAFMEVRE